MSVVKKTPAVTETHQSFSADIGNLKAIRQFLRTKCRELFPESIATEAFKNWLAELELGATELITNVIRHGFEGLHPGALNFYCSVIDDNVFRMRIEHNGRPFSSIDSDASEITEPLEGGMGLYLISSCVDSVDYRTHTDGTCEVELLKTLNS